jgi:molybdopterin/thiamine biosynthesis adenylyltransferase
MSGIDERAKELFQALSSKGFKRDRTSTKAFRYIGSLKAAGRHVAVSIIFADLEFTCLPVLALVNPEREAPHVVAHLSVAGVLCFARNEDFVLDRYFVGRTALMCLELARRGLERALTHKHLENEIAQEFPQHWLGIPFYHDIITATRGPAKLFDLPNRSGFRSFLLADRNDVLKRFVVGKADREKIIASSHPAFVFYSKIDLTFNRDFRQPNNLADFLAWLDNVLPNSREAAMRALARHLPPRLVSLFVCAPNGCVGVMLDDSSPFIKAAQRPQGLHRIIRGNADKIDVRRYSGTRIDLRFIFERNMNKRISLIGRRIALIGCGTIGSHLAKFLVQSGAGHEGGTLLLLDNQILEPGNVGRHYLGTTCVGLRKPDALKSEIQRQFPEANILPMSTDAVGFLGSLIGYDLVIDATGEEALSMSINDYFSRCRSDGEGTDIVYVRLFGNGAAAQALLVNGTEFACFKCLKPDHSRDWRFNPLKAKVEPAFAAAACGEGQFIPYGVAAPAMAASLALQIILDWNSGVPSPRMRTIRIEKKDTKEIADKNPDRSTHCPACGGVPT